MQRSDEEWQQLYEERLAELSEKQQQEVLKAQERFADDHGIEVTPELAYDMARGT